MGGKQHGGLGADGGKHVQDLAAAHGIQGGGGLVTNEQLGSPQQSLGNAQPLLHATGIPLDAMGLLLQAHQRKQLLDPRLQIGPLHAHALPAQAQILPRRHE